MENYQVWLTGIVADLQEKLKNVSANSGFGEITLSIQMQNGKIVYYKVIEEVTKKEEDVAGELVAAGVTS